MLPGRSGQHFCNLSYKCIHLSPKPQISGSKKTESYANVVNPPALRHTRRRAVRTGHVPHADDQGAQHRLGNIDQQEHAAAGHPVRRAGIARGLRTNRLRRRGLFGQLLGVRHRTDNEKRGVTDVMCTPKFGLINNSDSMSSVLYRAHVV